MLLFLAGGPSQYETFDPKPDGFDSFTSIAGHVGTVLPGVRFASYFPRLAERADRLSIVRSLVAKTGNHAKASKNLLTGGVEDPEGKEGAPAAHPSLGALLAHARGASNRRSGLPTYAIVPPIFTRTEGLRISSVNPGVESAFLGSGAGHLGAAYAPFNPSSTDGWNDLLTPKLPAARLDARRDLLREFDRTRRRVDDSPAYRDLDAMQQQAYDVLLGGAIRQALDLSAEDPRTRAAYDTSHCPIYNWDKSNRWIAPGPSTGFPLGNQLLLARRLCEAGSRFVTVVHSNWDMHGGEAIWGCGTVWKSSPHPSTTRSLRFWTTPSSTGCRATSCSWCWASSAVHRTSTKWVDANKTPAPESPSLPAVDCPMARLSDRPTAGEAGRWKRLSPSMTSQPPSCTTSLTSANSAPAETPPRR